MNLPAWYAAYVAAAIVLVVAGVAKLARPHDTARALRAAGLPGAAAAVRIGSAAEIVIGIAAVVTGNRVAAALVAASYVGFAAFVAQALVRRLPLSTCGCLGEPDTPPTVLHVVLDLGLAAAATVAAVRPVTTLWDEMTEHPAEAVVLTALVAVAVHLVITALAALPRTSPSAARR